MRLTSWWHENNLPPAARTKPQHGCQCRRTVFPSVSADPWHSAGNLYVCSWPNTQRWVENTEHHLNSGLPRLYWIIMRNSDKLIMCESFFLWINTFYSIPSPSHHTLLFKSLWLVRLFSNNIIIFFNNIKKDLYFKQCCQTINHENKSLCLHNICMYTVYIYYVYINTNTCMYIFKKICYVYILNIFIYNIIQYLTEVSTPLTFL